MPTGRRSRIILSQKRRPSQSTRHFPFVFFSFLFFSFLFSCDSASRYEIAELSCKPFENIREESVKSGFRAAGIHPFNPDEVLDKLAPNADRLSPNSKPLPQGRVVNRASFSDRLTQVETNNAALKLEVQELRALINSRKDSPDIEHGKGKRFKAEATILTKDEVVERLQKEQEEKARHISEMEKKRAALATKKEEEEKAKGLRMQQAYHTKWESLATRSEKLQSTLIDPEKAHQKKCSIIFFTNGSSRSNGAVSAGQSPSTHKQHKQTNKQTTAAPPERPPS